MALLVAHRGASSEAPENTMSAIQLGLEIGVDCVEIDVHLTADEQLVLIHDAIIGRTASGAIGKRIAHMTLAEIQKLDAGSWFGASFKGEKIPTLDQLLQLDRGTAGIMIEVKHGHAFPEPLAAAIVKSYRAAPKPDSLIVGSFSVLLLETVQKMAPEIPLMGIVEKKALLTSFDHLNLKYMALWYKLINPPLLATCHEAGQKIWTFTVDDLDTARFLLSIGIDGIISNKPRLLKEIFN
ncbi:MAG: hypothetical protein LLG04_07675 [Parachlamydia sp.]|nr:hypothetical protein [Parachlamydia sp.]